MEPQKSLHMKGGVGQCSYANNSLLQRAVAAKVKEVLAGSIKEVWHALQPKCFMMTDMGCSSGPNALFVVSQVMNVVDETCRSLNRPVPEFGVFLNDLLGNDFNTLFSFLPGFHKWVEQVKGSEFGPYFVSATPNSFHGRVFPHQFLHFVHSCYALHWLSKVPERLVSREGEGLNKGNICIAKTSPPKVHNAYYTQFKGDFTLFLRSRAMEVVPGGYMVLTFLGSIKSTHLISTYELLGSTLHDMVLEGIIEEETLNKFNIPLYSPTVEEVRLLIEDEGSFLLNKLETFAVDWSVDTTQDPDKRAELVANSIRAVFESLLIDASGEAIINDLFVRFKTRVMNHLAKQTGEYLNIVVSLSRRA